MCRELLTDYECELSVPQARLLHCAVQYIYEYIYIDAHITSQLATQHAPRNVQEPC